MIFQKPKKINAFTIAVGNITFGGTGKTPLCLALAKKLNAAILMRGYKGSFSKVGWQGNSISSRFEDLSKASKELGDEALLYLLEGISVFVGANRYETWNKFPKGQRKIAILDDGLQHRTIQKDFEVCLIDASAKLSEYRVPPFGRLRSPKSRVLKSSLVIFTRAHLVDSQKISELKEFFHLKDVLIFHKYHTKIRNFGENPSSYFLVAGIGNPQQLLGDLKNYKIERSIFLRDHGVPSEALIEELNNSLAMPLLTWKDAVKWAHRLKRFSIVEQSLDESHLEEVCAKIPLP